MLIVVGVVTAVPLLLFAASARKLPLSVIGLLQYITPTSQFLLAVTMFGEPLSARTLAAFAFIWTGLALFIAGSLRGAVAVAR